MRLDHVSYVASHEQISDVVQRIGSQIGTAFVDGGIHPGFGTRNFTAPLLNGQYIEVVCPLDHPAAEQTPFGKAVSRKAMEGGGWLTWVFSSNEISHIEKEFGRKAVEGHRRRPDGTELSWKQIGIIELLQEPSLPFFIQWLSKDHPSSDGKPNMAIKSIRLASEKKTLYNYISEKVIDSLTEEVAIEWGITDEDESAITSVLFSDGIRDVEIK